MTQQERRGWMVVGSLFTTLFLVFGSGYNTAGVFFTPLLTHFGWSRAQLSLLQTALALSGGLVVPLVGVLMDRIEARVVIVSGAVLSGIGFLMASRVNAFAPMMLAYVMLGAGIAASTLLPCAMVIANWFGERRGLALGLTLSGTSVGGMLMTLVASRAIHWSGWRAAYVVLAIPMFVIVIPLVLAVVRTHPHSDAKVSVADAAELLPGLEVREALRTRSFWMLAMAQFFFAFAIAGANLHSVPYLIGIGYEPARAALVLSLVLGFAGAGKLAMGMIADRVSGRLALVANFILNAGGLTLLLFAANGVMVGAFVVLFGLTVGAPLALIPMVTADSLGLKRFGSLSGMLGIFNTLGAASGPVFAGRMFDLTGSYSAAFELFAVMLLMGATATFACAPLKHRESAGRPLAAPASA